jgi:hypothetical protein
MDNGKDQDQSDTDEQRPVGDRKSSHENDDLFAGFYFVGIYFYREGPYAHTGPLTDVWEDNCTYLPFHIRSR